MTSRVPTDTLRRDLNPTDTARFTAGTTARVATGLSYADHDHLRALIRDALGSSREAAAVLKRADGNTLVVVKPNWIQEGAEGDPEAWEALITHPELVKAAVDVLLDAMGGRGTLAICDAPHTYASWDAILDRGDLANWLADRGKGQGTKIEVIDLRREIWRMDGGVVVERRANSPDPRGYYAIDLAELSQFAGHHGEGRYYGADYDTVEVNRHHAGAVHEYLLAGTPFSADLFVNLPKLKTHKKTGITAAMKNLVGINGDKNWLPHHTKGTPRDGGDEYPDINGRNLLEVKLKPALQQLALAHPAIGGAFFKAVRQIADRTAGATKDPAIRNGNWHGNDTCWRMVVDLNRAFLFGHPDGFRTGQRRPYIVVLDGIVAGEGNGPLSPTPVDLGVIAHAPNPAEMDLVACRVLGFEPRLVPTVAAALTPHPLRLSDQTGSLLDDDIEPLVRHFEPHHGWRCLKEVTAP